MKIRIINGLILGITVVFLGLATQASEKSLLHATSADAASVASRQNPAQVDLHGRGEKLPVLQKCGKRFGHIFSYCYSQQYFAVNRTVIRLELRAA